MRKMILLLALLTPLSLWADLQIYPTRLHLNPRTKNGTLSIKLKSDKPETYRISTMFYEMKPDGSMVQRPDLSRSEESAASFLRYSPKRVTLQPNVEQVIRVSTKKLNKIKRKEVRTHLYFRPEDSDTKNSRSSGTDGKKSAFSLKAKVAVAIPIIVSTEPTDRPHKLKNFRVYSENGTNYFSSELVNSSNKFLYGDFKVTRQDGDGSTVVAAANGVSSYIPQRIVKFPFLKNHQGEMKSGTYILEFLEYSGVSKDKGLVTKVKFKK